MLRGVNWTLDSGRGTRDFIGEKIWHESQKITKMPNGALEMTFQVAGLDEIKRWVLSFGPEAQVLEPTRLLESIRSDLQKTLGHYARLRISDDMLREPRVS